MVSSFHAPNVAIETGADVIQLVQDGNHLLLESLIEEAGQVEREDVQHLTVFLIEPLHRPRAAMSPRGESPALESHGRQLRLQTMQHLSSGLCERHQDARHVDVQELIQPTGDVIAQPQHGVREVKRRVQRLVSTGHDELPFSIIDHRLLILAESALIHAKGPSLSQTRADR